MKKYLAVAIIALCAGRASAQVFTIAARRVDLENDVHYGAYLQSNTDPDDRTKIIWYPNVGLYRKCAEYVAPKKIPSGFHRVAVNCGCEERFPYSFGGPTAAPFGNVQFAFNSAVLPTSSYPLLDLTSDGLQTSGKTIEIGGFSSSEGDASANLDLARQRAIAVKTYLVNAGVDPKKIKLKAYGETKPIADNSTEEGRVQNRRVEFSNQ